MKKNYWKYIILILIFSIIIMLPKILNQYQMNDDTQYHITNTLATVSTMDDWIPDDILPNIAGSYGYATRQFYPVLAHTTTAYTMKITNLSVTDTFKLVHTLVLFLSGVAMFFLGLRYLKKDYLAFTAAIIYILMPYHLTDIYIRDALAECFIFIFVPIVLNGLSYLFEDKKKFLLLFSIGYIGGMLSHLTMMVYLTVLLIPFFIINYKKVFNKKTIITLLEAAIIILGVMAPNIIQLLQNKASNLYEVFVPGVMAQGIQHSGLWIQLFDYLGVFNPIFNNSNAKYYFDIIALILLVIVIIKRKEIDFKNYKFIIIFGICSFTMSLIIFPWDLLPNGFRIIQFPWRLGTFSGLALALIAPLALDKIKVNYKIVCGAMLVLGLLFNTTSDRQVLNLNSLDYNAGMGWQKEYLPISAYNNWDDLSSRNYQINVSNGEAKITSDYITDLKFTISEDTTVVLPRLYYLGYYLYDSNGNSVSIKESDEGLITASVSAGDYSLIYKQTKEVRIAKIVSIITLIVSVLFLLLEGKFKKLEKEV